MGVNAILKEITLYIFYFSGAVLLGWMSVMVYSRQPAAWLCDYGEEPGTQHEPPRLRREKLVACVCSAGFFVTIFILFEITGAHVSYGLVILPALWLALQICLADWRYMIIPDQWTALLALPGLIIVCLDMRSLAAGAPGMFHVVWYSPLLGMGAGLVLAGVCGLIWVVARKEIIGFGDVKLVVVIGLVCGLGFALQILLLAFFVSGMLFGALLVCGRLKTGEAKPLGPFLMAALTVHLLFPDWCRELARWLVTF